MPAISNLLPRLETGQAAWSFLDTRYNCTYDFALKFYIKVKLYQMRQESGQSISDYYSQTASMWEQLAVAVHHFNMLKTSIFLPSTKIVVASHSL